MSHDKITKIPFSIADAKNVIDIKSKKNTIIIKYELKQHFSDFSTSLTEQKNIIITYPKKVKNFEAQVDDDDNLFLAVNYVKSFNFFGWKFIKETDETNTPSTSDI